MTLLSRDAYFAIADEARKFAIPFMGHIPDAIKSGGGIRRGAEEYGASHRSST